MIKAENITKFFHKDGARIDVLRNICLEINRGDTVAILGASGAGKTTLLQILGSLDHPTNGTVFYDSCDIFSMTEGERARFRNSHVGFVFQFHHLLPEFTTWENVMMPALIGGASREETADKAKHILSEVGLAYRLHHKPGELSGGEQQRVAVARALMRDPAVLLADEPTGNLDTETGHKVQDLLFQLARSKGTTLVVVTHNEQLAGHMSRTIGLKDGEICYEKKN